MGKNKNLKKVADDLFKSYPDKVKVFITTDGQGFFSKNHAANHANKNKLDLQEFFRDGYQVEDNSAMEDLLITAEEKVRGYDATLEKIQDIANVEVEDAIEVDDQDPEAVKAVIELRLKYEEVVSTLADVSEDQQAYRVLVASLEQLVKDDKSKLAKEINALLPVKLDK